MVHPLLGTPLPVVGAAWESDLNQNYTPYLCDHVIDEVAVYPAAAYVEAGLAIHGLIDGTDSAVLESLSFSRALLLGNAQQKLQWRFDERTREFEAYSRTD